MLNFTNVGRNRIVRLMFQTQECGTWNIPQRFIYKDLNLFFPTLTSAFKANRGCSAYKKGTYMWCYHCRPLPPSKVLFVTLFFPWDIKWVEGWLKRIKSDSRAARERQEDQEYIYTIFWPWIWLTSITEECCKDFLRVITIY